MAQKKVALIVGSLRKESLNRKMAMNIIELAPSSMKCEILEIGQLALYNEDVDRDPPQAWTDFRSRLKTYDGVLFITPEYNRSVPGVLKNAIDVGSRPYGQSAWAGKPAGIMSVSPGGMGAFGANHHLRQSLVFLDMPTLQQPEAYVGHAAKSFDENGKLVSATREFVEKFINAYAAWLDRLQAR